MEERKIKRWITVNGNHIPIYEGQHERQAVSDHFRKIVDRNMDERERQLSQNGSNYYGKQFRDPEELLPKDSYTNEEKYLLVKEELGNIHESLEQKTKEWMSANNQLKKEVEVDPELGRTLSEVLELYTEKGKTLKPQVDALYKEMQDMEHRRDELGSYLRRVDAVNSEIQKAKYRNQESTISRDIKPMYQGFQMRSNISYYDDLLDSGKGYIVEMSPKQYLQEVAYNIFTDSTLERTLRGVITGDRKDVNQYAEMMAHGISFDMPYLNYEEQAQEGRHRAVAAYMNDYDRIPVLVVPKRKR